MKVQSNTGIQIGKYIGGNVIKAALLIIAVSIVAFILVSAAPVDPVRAYVGC